MNKRQGLQLQLQATVEGLSVAAITYYIMGLIEHLTKAGEKLGWIQSPDIASALVCLLWSCWCGGRSTGSTKGSSRTNLSAYLPRVFPF